MIERSKSDDGRQCVGCIKITGSTGEDRLFPRIQQLDSLFIQSRNPPLSTRTWQWKERLLTILSTSESNQRVIIGVVLILTDKSRVVALP